MTEEITSFRNYLLRTTPMDEESFDAAVPYLKTERIKKGGFLVREGQICTRIAFIHQGIFRIYSLKEGVEVNTCFCMEDSITSSFSSFTNQVPSTESIRAMEDSVIVTLSFSDLASLCRERIAWQNSRLLLTEKECLRLSDRVNALNFESALEKYRSLLRDQPEIIRRVPVQHIASYLGVSRETLSRIRARIGGADFVT